MELTKRQKELLLDLDFEAGGSRHGIEFFKKELKVIERLQEKGYAEYEIADHPEFAFGFAKTTEVGQLFCDKFNNKCL